jgi:hypothetical protein
MSYSLGWSIIPQTLVRRERWPGGHKTKSSPLVYPGQEVQPDQPVLRIDRVESPALSESIPTMPTMAPRLMLPSSSNNSTSSPSHGSSNHVGGAEVVPAGLRGRVVDLTRRGGVVIEGQAAVLQGTIGAGNQVAGILTMWSSTPSGQSRTGPLQQGPQVIPPGAILVVPGPLNFSMLRQAASSGVVGIIASSISLRDLEGFLRIDLIQLLDAETSEQTQTLQAHFPPLTLLFTEGLGALAMPVRVVNLLSQYQGSIVLLSGATSARQGIVPELVISLPARQAQLPMQPVQPNLELTPQAQVRVCAGEHIGQVGIIDHLFAYEQEFPAGIRARAVRLRLEDGSALVVPTTQIERIG